MTIDYARTSTADQIAGLEAQLKEFQSDGCEKIFQEKASSVDIRPQLQSANEFVREGDFLLITKLDRLARSVSDLMVNIQNWEARNCSIRAGNYVRTSKGRNFKSKSRRKNAKTENRFSPV